MQHKVFKAATTATDQGQFTAIAAAYSVDRGNEQIERGAFEKTISHWQSSGKQIPLHWDHSASPEDIIGSVDPKDMREADEGLYVKGQLDLENSDVAREAWRLMKSNVVSLSFGYLVNDEEDIDGVKHLKAIDLFELTITPAPMNPDTRFLKLKSEKRELAKEFVAEVNELSQEVEERRELLKEALEGRDEETEGLRKDADNIAFNLATEGIAEVEQEDAPPPDPQRVLDHKAEVAPEPETKAQEPEAPDETSQDVPLQVDEDRIGSVDEQPAVEDARDEEPVEAKSPAQDPLRKANDRLAYELATRGITPAKPPKAKAEPTEVPSMEQLRRDCERLMLETLIGDVNP